MHVREAALASKKQNAQDADLLFPILHKEKSWNLEKELTEICKSSKMSSLIQITALAVKLSSIKTLSYWENI
jgi:hypothetical protein